VCMVSAVNLLPIKQNIPYAVLYMFCLDMTLTSSYRPTFTTTTITDNSYIIIYGLSLRRYLPVQELLRGGDVSEKVVVFARKPYSIVIIIRNIFHIIILVIY